MKKRRERATRQQVRSSASLNPNPTPTHKLPKKEQARLFRAVREFLEGDSLSTWGPNPAQHVSSSAPAGEFFKAKKAYEAEAREAIKGARVHHGLLDDVGELAPAAHPLRRILEEDLLPKKLPKKRSSSKPRGAPLKVTPEQVIELKNKFPGATLKSLAKRCKDEYGVSISVKTLTRQIKNASIEPLHRLRSVLKSSLYRRPLGPARW